MLVEGGSRLGALLALVVSVSGGELRVRYGEHAEIVPPLDGTSSAQS